VWDPANALADAAKLFGVVSLGEIVGAVEDLQNGLDIPGLPRFEVVTVPGDGALDPPKAICQQMVWEPALKSWPGTGSPVLIVADDLAKNGLPTPFDEPSAARVFLEACVHFDGAAPTTEIDVRIDRVAIQLPPLVPGVALLFDELRYHQPPGASGQVTTRLEDWLFVGFLEWLEPVRQFVLELLDLADVEISDAGIFISCQIPVPSLSFGVVGVTDLDVGLDLDLPSDDASQISFALSERTDPFAITVFGFGGSGSFELQLAADRIVFLEGSLAVTYELSVDIVIASASLSASLGVAVTLEQDSVELAAYVELRGSVGILGLVDVTGSVVLALIYGLQTKLLRGVATMTGEVDSIFGKSDVSFEAEVEVPLAGGTSARALAAIALDVTATALSFADRFSTDEWTDYCDAYA
jgi:hypothetical protein